MALPAFLFAKPPVPGLSKTRLAQGVGPDAAAALAGAFLRDTWDALLRTPGVFPVLATTDPSADFGFPVAPRVDQGDGDLGARLQRVLAAGVAAHGGALAVGADSPGMPADRVAGAVWALGESDACMVPTDDGGFALLALGRCPNGLFDDLPWSSPRTAEALLERMRAFGMDCRVLPAWFDVDHAVDLDRLRAEVLREAAPFTWSVLDTLR